MTPQQFEKQLQRHRKELIEAFRRKTAPVDTPKFSDNNLPKMKSKASIWRIIKKITIFAALW